MSSAYKRIIEEEDWNKTSNCEDGYINVSDEKAMNGFVFEFKEKCDTNFINNFKLIEKDEQEELQIFNYSQLHYRNLERLLLQGRATQQRKLLSYSFKYLNVIKEIEMMKIESITRYFIENFQKLKDKRNKELKEIGKATGENDKEERDDTYWEWENKTGQIRLGFWSNNLVGSNYRTTSSKFTNLPITVREFYKNYVVNNVIIRFFWCAYDIREYLFAEKLDIESAYTPYMSIAGTFYLEEMKYPAKMIEKGTWLIRDMIGDQYKHGEGKDGQFTKNVKMRYKIILPDNIYIKDLKEVQVGLYDQDTGKWRLEAQDVGLKIGEKERGRTCNLVEFTTTELGIFGVLIERKINFPYKDWNIRCIKDNKNNLVAILDLVTPRTKFVFELGLLDNVPEDREATERIYPCHAYMKLIDNEEECFNHIANKYLTFDQMILALKDCGILIAPWKEDIEEIGFHEKNYETANRAVDDIVMACRYYSIRAHNYNKLIETDKIVVKAKPNPEFDKKFLDDEEKDWIDFLWYPNKASIGKYVLEGENLVFKQSIETTRPKLHQIIKDTQPKEIYEQISEDDFSSAFLVNIRNVIRVLYLVNIP